MLKYTVVEKVLLLQNVDLLSAARTEDLAVLASIADEVLYPAGATVFQEGQPADGLYVVIRGELVLTRNGKEVDRVGKKSALGAWGLIDQSPRVFGSRAASETLLLRVDRQDFYDLLLDYPELGQSMLKAMVRRFRNLVTGDVPAAVEFGRVAAAPVNTLRQQPHRCQEISVCF